MRSATTFNLKEFFTNTLCTNDEQDLDNYLQNNNVDLPKCNDLATYEASRFKLYKGQPLQIKANSEFAPLSTYLGSYVDELRKKHNDHFLAGSEFLKNFDELGKIYVLL